MLLIGVTPTRCVFIYSVVKTHVVADCTGSRRLFYSKSHLSPVPSLLLSKMQTFHWFAFWFFFQCLKTVGHPAFLSILRKAGCPFFMSRKQLFLIPACYVTGCSPLALPLGELSPQVTERVLQPFSNDKIDLCAHTTKISVDIPVGESQNIQPKRHQELRTFSIISKPLRFIMLRTIQFNDQSGRSTVKVHDESADDSLFVNFYWIFAEIKVPELTLVGCHLPAKPPGIFQLGIVFWYCHCLPSPSSLHSATSPIGRGKGCLHGSCFTTTRLCVSFFFAKSGVILKKYFQNPMQPVNCFWSFSRYNKNIEVLYRQRFSDMQPTVLFM